MTDRPRNPLAELAAYSNRGITPPAIPHLELDQEQMRAMLNSVTQAFDGMKEALRPFVQAMAKVTRAVGRMVEGWEAAANAPAHVAGLEGRYYVRGALDPAYALPEQRDALVHTILHASLEVGEHSEAAEDCWLLTQDNRRQVAVAVMRGWAQHRSVPTDEPLVWHRAMGAVHVQVGVAS